MDEDVPSEGDNKTHCSGDGGLGGSSSPPNSWSYRDLLKSHKDICAGGKNISLNPFLATRRFLTQQLFA